MLLVLLHHGCTFANAEDSKTDNSDAFLLLRKNILYLCLHGYG